VAGLLELLEKVEEIVNSGTTLSACIDKQWKERMLQRQEPKERGISNNISDKQ
jgi:hypothetical protein